MNGLEGIGVAGDLLSWIGLGLGVPLLLVGTFLRAQDVALLPVEIVIVRGPHEPLARWYAGDAIHERTLDPTERSHYAGKDTCTGYISPRIPSRMRLERHRQVTRSCRALGTTLTVIGLVGFVLSILPVLLG